ncbi:hypothetical protein BJP40_03900 [Streptomyces sp. CC53]|uniref:type II toxin-antitoxin system RelE family toxin n=1 Tax=Streptomyces sp. CC53 TaxID=1906740 RepID=UPI0008DCDCD1|nr:hypothetical protein [Streptomyces sp. CC53]OII62154.1 hypothetical protein BJP40_03900 [Streptomyces sp. CC53]
MTIEGRPAFGLTFDPRALTDLLQAPGDIRDLSLALLQDVVNADRAGGKLTAELAGLRKLYVDHRAAWRIVYALRPAPATSAYPMEIHVVAVRPRANHDVYDTAAQRLGITPRPLGARAYAARTRSTQIGAYRTVPKPGPPPGLPRPAQSTVLTTKAAR